MKLVPKSERELGTLPVVREDPDVVQRLGETADKAGVSSPEAIRQLLAAYVARPYDLEKLPIARRGLTSRLGPVKLDAGVLKAFQAHAEDAELSMGEAVRRVVRRFLAKQGA